MLNDDKRLIRPSQLRNQIEWEKLEAVVVLGLGKDGERNVLHMSTLTITELSLLVAQLNAHLNAILGPMDER